MRVKDLMQFNPEAELSVIREVSLSKVSVEKIVGANELVGVVLMPEHLKEPLQELQDAPLIVSNETRVKSATRKLHAVLEEVQAELIRAGKGDNYIASLVESWVNTRAQMTYVEENS